MNTSNYKNGSPLSRIKVKLTMSGINLDLPNEALSWSKMFQKVICGALADRDITAELPPTELMRRLGIAGCPAFAVGIGCEAMGVFGVTDLAVGLTIIHAELEDLSFLDRSEIAWLDTRESIWRYYYPYAQSNQMESTEATSLAWIETLIARLKKAQGL